VVALAAFLDEARRDRHHPILSVGGIALATHDWLALEEAWAKAKVRVGLHPAQAVRYADTWEDHTLRLPLVQQIPNLGVPLKGVAALLEDFRPDEMRQRKETRRDMYIQRRAFAYVLQRLAERQYLPRDAAGPHVVYAHRHDDFRCYDEEYAKAWSEGWSFPTGRRVRPLRELGFVASPAAMSGGPAMEIADLVGSVTSRWAEAMVAVTRGREIPDLEELEAAMAALAPLFPSHPNSDRRRGYSIVAHNDRRHGREIIYDNVDSWLGELLRRDGTLAA
jgi:hypothetical protein